LDQEEDWGFKATRFKAENIDYRFFGGPSKESLPLREHYAYNFFVKDGIKAAIRHSHIAENADEIELIIDEKARTKEDNFLKYVRRAVAEMCPGVSITVRDCPSETERLVQVCDIITGAHNTLLVQGAGTKKIATAQKLWLGRCQQYHHQLQEWK